MTQPAGHLSLFAKIRDKFRYGLIFLVMRDYLMKIGIEISPFYWMKETVPAQIPVFADGSLEGFEFSQFGAPEIEEICRLPERQYINPEKIRRKFNDGQNCYGVKYKGAIAGFSWFDLRKNETKYPAPIREHEAYLSEMYILKAFRGKNLAPILRCKVYAILKEKGCRTCYSITEAFNTPSRKFKEKLNAQYVFLGIYVGLFKKFSKRWVIKRYKENSSDDDS